MKWLTRATGVLAAAVLLAVAVSGYGVISAHGRGTPDREQATPPTDQTEPTADETTPDEPASAVPVDGFTGMPASVGTYATEVWEPGEVDNDRGLAVISTTASGTWALTGIVQDQSTGSPVLNATVSLSCTECSTLTTTSNATGAFAFINVPVSSTSTLAVDAPGYGSYTVRSGPAAADEEYQTTVELTSEPQAYDDSQPPRR